MRHPLDSSQWRSYLRYGGPVVDATYPSVAPPDSIKLDSVLSGRFLWVRPKTNVQWLG
jgi:hypothetical protein